MVWNKRMTTGYGVSTLIGRIKHERVEVEMMMLDGRINKPDGEAIVRALDKAVKYAHRARRTGNS